MPKLNLNDISMYYETHGSGIPIVFIAGFSCDHLIWAGLVEHFDAKKYQLIFFDNRGAGQTDIPDGPYSIEEMTQDVVNLCSELGINQAHFVGNSMGGFILQTLAFQHPDLVRSAIISHSSLTLHTPFHIYVGAQLELIKAKAPLESLIKASCSWTFSFQFLSRPGMLESLIQMTLDNPYPFTVKGYEGQYAALNQFDSRSWVHQIQVPTLVLGSDQDLIFSQSSEKQIAKQIPNAIYYDFSDCGHLPQIECPKLFSRVVLDFIDRVENHPSTTT